MNNPAKSTDFHNALNAYLRTVNAALKEVTLQASRQFWGVDVSVNLDHVASRAYETFKKTSPEQAEHINPARLNMRFTSVYNEDFNDYEPVAEATYAIPTATTYEHFAPDGQINLPVILPELQGLASAQHFAERTMKGLPEDTDSTEALLAALNQNAAQYYVANAVHYTVDNKCQRVFTLHAYGAARKVKVY